MKTICIPLILLATLCLECHGQPTTPQERTQKLVEARARYQEPLAFNFNVIRDSLTLTQRLYLRNTLLEIDTTDDILYAFTYGLTENKIVISAATLLFLEELGTALAWYDHNINTDITPIANYILLARRYRAENRPLPSLTKLLNVPADDIWEQSKYFSLKNFARNFINSSTTWILSHEIGHKANGDVDNGSIRAHLSNQEKEMQADAFATEMILRLGLFPEAVATAMTFYSMYKKVRIEFPDNEAWSRYLTTSSHPIWPERMENLAAICRHNSSRIRQLGRDPNQSAMYMETIAAFLKNYDILSALLVGTERLNETNLLTYDPFQNIDSKYLPWEASN